MWNMNTAELFLNNTTLSFFFDNRFYLPVKLVTGYTLTELLDEPWSHRCLPLPRGTYHQYIARRVPHFHVLAFYSPRRFTLNFPNAPSRTFDLSIWNREYKTHWYSRLYVTSTNNAACKDEYWPEIRRTHGWRPWNILSSKSTFFVEIWGKESLAEGLSLRKQPQLLVTNLGRRRYDIHCTLYLDVRCISTVVTKRYIHFVVYTPKYFHMFFLWILVLFGTLFRVAPDHG